MTSIDPGVVFDGYCVHGNPSDVGRAPMPPFAKSAKLNRLPS